MNQLAAYLLAYEKSDGGPLCTYGALSAIVYFPANLTVTFNVTPVPGVFCHIIFWYKESPSLVPEALEMDSTSAGLVWASGPLTSIANQIEFPQPWFVIREDQQMVTTLTNRTNLIQREDFAQTWLTIASKPDYDMIMGLIRDWCEQREVIVKLEEIHRTLKRSPGGG